jgi:hypothetical protein
MEKNEFVEVLECALLLFDGCKKSDLLLKYGLNAKNILKGQEVLEFLNK